MLNFKKFSAVLSSLTIIFNMLSPMISFAEVYNDFVYSVSEDKVIISGCNFNGENLVIPDIINDMPVTSITSDALKECSNVISVEIGSNLESIGDNVFSSCTSLQKIETDSQNKYFSSINGSLYSKDGQTLIRYAGNSSVASIADNTVNIGNHAFFNVKGVYSVNIPNSVLNIGNYSFTSCADLKEIKIPDSVKNIGKDCFMYCSSLENVFIGKGIEYIPEGCFSLCSSLDNAVFSDNITSIEDEAFYGCWLLSEIFIPDTVQYIGKNAVGMYYDIRTGTDISVENFTIYGYKENIAESYASENSLIFYDISNVIYGDTNLDGSINASDASETLAEYASVSAGAETSFNKIKFIVSDYNSDGSINASDASEILSRYAEISSGG